MDARAYTSSGRWGEPWDFLPAASQSGQARSLPQSSSYLRSSERSNVSPLPPALYLHQLNASRSSLPRHAQTPSIGGHSATTIPTQPLLLPINSENAEIQGRRILRQQKLGDMKNNKNGKLNELPPIHEFSIQGILAAIEDDIEEDVNAVSEILGKSRLVLADQHESHLPPQGEIRATGSPLQAVAEASSSNERLAATDDVLIVGEDASLIEGSHAGSAAYGLLERLQTVPRTRRMRSEQPSIPASRPATSPVRHYSAPVVLPEPIPPIGRHDPSTMPTMPISSRQLFHVRMNGSEGGEVPSRTTNAVVSETYLSAGANAITVSDPPIISESGRHYPLYSYDYADLFEGPTLAPPPTRPSFRERMHTLLAGGDLHGLTSWVPGRASREISAEAQLREILDRQSRSTRSGRNIRSPHEDTELYL